WRRLLSSSFLRRGLLRRGLLSCGLLSCGLFRGRLLGGLLSCTTDIGSLLRTTFRQQLIGALIRQSLWQTALAQRGIGGAIGHIRTKATIFDRHWLTRDVIVTELFQRWLRSLASATLRLSINTARFIQGDGEDLFFIRQRTRVRTLLEVRAIATILCRDDLIICRIHANFSRQGQQLQSIF